MWINCALGTSTGGSCLVIVTEGGYHIYYLVRSKVNSILQSKNYLICNNENLSWEHVTLILSREKTFNSSSVGMCLELRKLSYDKAVSNILTTAVQWCMVRILISYVISTNFRSKYISAHCWLCSSHHFDFFLSSTQIEHGEWWFCMLEWSV
jgi:hypothetical protein